MKKLLLIAATHLLLVNTKAQSALYSETFEGSATALPAGRISTPATNGIYVIRFESATEQSLAKKIARFKLRLLI